MKKSTLLAIVLVLVNVGLDAQTPCPNSVINGDFEAGNTGFTSGLAYNCDCVDATVCVNANFGQKCRGWSTLGNHTPGGTNYLIVDGSSTGPVNVWASTVPVSPGDTYTFSFWVATAYVSRDLIFDLGMIVNGQTVRQFTVSQATPTWTQYSVTGICPVGLRSMPIAIRQMTGGSFRDFGIDDIYFACCECKADYTTTNLDGCGRVQFNNTSIVPGGISYSWDFGDTASGMNNSSTEPNPIHHFSKCGTYNVCLTLKGEGCSSKICYTVDASDNTLPFIICPRNQTVNTNPGQCYFTGTLPQPSTSDNCDPSPEIVCSLITPTSSILITPQTQFPKGENTIVCFARDKCGNVSRSCSYVLTVTGKCPPDPPADSCNNNLVPNPSFEQFTTCPPGISPPFTAANWSLPTTGGSSDYYNSCAPVASNVSTPVNSFGTQAPRTGSGYAGFILRPTNLYREYLEVKLSAPLVAGNTYQVSFYVNLADQAQWAIDKFGAYLSKVPVGPIAAAPVLPLVPQVMHPSGTFITDKTNWTQISGTYLASGGEQYLVIGNFSDNVATTPQTNLGGFYPGAYYYIDDVSVCASCVKPPCDSCCTDSLTFAVLVNQGFTVVNKGCSVTVTAPQFDSCYHFNTPPVLDGGIAPQVITDPSGSWTFNFTQSGVHQICVTVFDGCQSKQMCTTVRVNCDTCACGALDWATFLQMNGGFSSPIRCGGNNIPALPVPCPKPGQDYLIHGNYRCIPDSCGNNTVSWVLDRPGALPDVPGVSNTTYPHFDVPIPWNLCTTPGTYVLHISRKCGGKECPCSFKFEVPPCPCTCDQLGADITAGFKTVGIQPFNTCKRSFMPYALCPNDVVTWRIGGSIVPGNTTGNAIKMITFSGPGIYQVYMTVIRTNPNGTKCGGEIWQNVKVNCDPGGINPKITFCANDVIQNGDFTEGVEAGDRGPRKPWTPVIPADGRSFVFGVDSSGSGDAGHLILNGGKASFAGVWQEVNLTPNLFTTIEFDYKNYLGKNSPAGTVLEFRLEPDSISGGPSQVLYRQVISDTSAAWTNVVVSVKASPNPDFKYLFICVQNDDDALQSVVGIDNLSMCTSSISDTKQLSLLKPIRIFPNPNPGSFNVELPEPAITGMTLRVTDLAGRQVLEKPTQTGNKLQTVQVENMPGGMYLLQVIEKGRVVGVEKFVKQ